MAARIDSLERQALDFALAGEAVDAAYIFGSRVDARRRGGDVDLLVYSREDPFVLSRRIATRFFSRCEEKIDVVVVDPQNLRDDERAFVAAISSQPMERFK